MQPTDWMIEQPHNDVEEKLRQEAFLDACRDVIADRAAALGRPLRFVVHTFGCQMNARDSEKLAGVLSAAGFVESDTEEADFILFNTCTVRDNADQRLFGRLGRVHPWKKSHPEAKIALCGCMMQEKTNVEKIRQSYPFVDLIFGTHNLFRFPEYLYLLYHENTRVIDIWDKTERVVEELPTLRKYPFKSGVNIMFGCDKFCTYCIVPYVRGRERSRDSREIIEEIKRLADDGVKEVMLLGQNVNAYGKGRDDGIRFEDLLEKVCRVDGIERIRFMTPHPRDFTTELLDLMAAEEKIARHIHLPLQSGSSRVLKAMNRGHDKEAYLDLALSIRSRLPEVAVTTDLITGFPTETEEDVEETLDVIRQVRFDNAYTFLFSPRRGTPAASMVPVRSEAEIHASFDRILSAIQACAKERALLLQGSVQTALLEEVDPQEEGLLTGRLSNNMIVHVPGDASRIGSFLPVHLTECHGFYYLGSIAETEACHG